MEFMRRRAHLPLLLLLPSAYFIQVILLILIHSMLVHYALTTSNLSIVHFGWHNFFFCERVEGLKLANNLFFLIFDSNEV